jgi:hypothetical protein
MPTQHHSTQFRYHPLTFSRTQRKSRIAVSGYGRVSFAMQEAVLGIKGITRVTVTAQMK